MPGLADTSVFLDFDGTISTADIGVHLLDRLATEEWRHLDVEYASGRIGSRECLDLEWAMLPQDEALLRATAREVPLDPGFQRLVDDLRAAGAEVLVVSDGFGFYAEEACAAAGVDLLSNAVDWNTGQLEYPNVDRCCPCSTCGTCKQAPVKDARRRGRATVLVGDGTSDRKAALLADRIFAKDGLAEWCEFSDVPYTPFRTLADVRRVLLP